MYYSENALIMNLQLSVANWKGCIGIKIISCKIEVFSYDVCSVSKC